MESPVGPLTISSGPDGLEAIGFGLRPREGELPDPAGNAAVLAELEEYFQGSRRRFDLPLSLDGTPFQETVWRALIRIPYGATRTYGEIARALGRPAAARAVGRANHANPIPIVIPCHRVIGHDRDLVGYGGGLEIKARLLALEGVGGATEGPATSRRARGRSTLLSSTAH